MSYHSGERLQQMKESIHRVGALDAKYYFNYAGDLLTALVPRMADRNKAIREPACSALAAIVQVYAVCLSPEQSAIALHSFLQANDR
eukprot:scaffold512633_cov19-Prasinocladus_malaysianus.AAC.1